MRNLTDHLSTYAAYHRDRRNIATHFIGIPMIVLAVAALSSRPQWPVFSGALMLSPASFLFGVATIFYLLLDVPLGLCMAIVSALSLLFGDWAAKQATTMWFAIGIGLFLVGWVFQFIGHVRYEHRKPAFVDDIIGLAIGPLFILVELMFLLGLRRDLRNALAAHAQTHTAAHAR